MGMVKVQLVDMVNGEPLTTQDQPAELDDSISSTDLVEQILNLVGRLPEGHLVEAKATKIVNKSRRAELSSQQSLADVGTEDGDTLALYYSTVFGGYRGTRAAGWLNTILGTGGKDGAGRRL